nr:orotidine-5-phosphate decarboxylase [Candidatus Cloacimonadota bacterium]
MSKSFWLKYHERVQKLGSHLCIGLDSQLDRLPKSLKSSANPIRDFNEAIIAATSEYATAYKPNLAFYLADGLRGVTALYDTIESIPDEIPVILDCKVGDIGSTMANYMQAFFKELKVDAITINPLMGADVVKPLLDVDYSFAFVLALTSNPSADDFFHRYKIKDAVSTWLAKYPIERLGAVVGATQVADLKTMRQKMPGRLFLIPGIGAQGGDLPAVLSNTVDSHDDPRILINSSRGIIFASKGEDYASAAGEAARKLYEACKIQ